MSMDLVGDEGRRFCFDIISWSMVLNLAQQYGWEPTGTEPPEVTVTDMDGNVDREMTEQYTWAREEWDGNYSTNDFQRVTEEDAANLAEALERALDDIPDFDTGNKLKEFTPDDPPAHPVAQATLWEGGLERLVGPNNSLSPVEFFSGEGKQKTRDFIAFCRAGEFLIA